MKQLSAESWKLRALEMQVLIPISSTSSFFPANEYFFPKPLVEVAEKPMIDIVINHIKSQLTCSRFIFVVDKADITSFSLDRTLDLLTNQETKIIEKSAETEGALCSCLLAIDAMSHDEPLLIINGDQLIDHNLSQIVRSFLESSAAAGVITFDSVHPRWSFASDDDNGNVLEVCEKRVISRNAIAGFYYYDTAKRFFDAAKDVLIKGCSTNGLFYISSTLNEVILNNGVVKHFKIPSSSYHSFYSPAKISEFERTEFAKQLRQQAANQIVNIIIPAAGEGSRFRKQGWHRAKPFIDINGKPMIQHVTENIKSTSSRTTVIIREKDHLPNKSIIDFLKANNIQIQSLPSITEGTACTVLSCHSLINTEQPLLIANSDQLIDLDINIFINDAKARLLDGSILVFKDPIKNPKWSFAKVDTSTGLVTEVAEKNPISELATVGIYYFAKGKDFVDCALDMIIANDRVNGEFYTCPIYNYMIKSGKKIGCFEIPFHAMSGIGTPEDLIQYISDRNWPLSVDMPEDSPCK